METKIPFFHYFVIFCFRFLYGVFYGYCIEHLFFNLSIDNVPLVTTNKLKIFLSMFIISNSIFLLQNIYQYFDHSNKMPFCTIDQFHNFMTLTYYFIIVI